jgi:alkaline phosphatase
MEFFSGKRFYDRRPMSAIALVGLLAAAACAPPAPPSSPDAAPVPSRFIVMVADGAGVAQWTAALHAAGDLAVRAMPVIGLMDTPSADRRVTDSAAGATAFATGERTFYRAVGVGVACREMMRADSAAVRRDPTGCAPLESALEIARDRGLATGLVTTAAVTDATPAAFVAKAPSRYWYDEIADQIVAARLDVLMGGGRGYFAGGARYDGRDVTAALCEGALCITTPEELARYRPDERRLVGLFTGEAMPFSDAREPSLPAMVEAAIARLAMNPRGFFALFESEGTDDAGHQRVPLEQMAAEMLDFDAAVAVALDYARATPGTLLLVLSDHESGGMTILPARDTVTATYTTGGHSATMVPIFAYGPGAERFGGILRNDEVGTILKELVRGR